MLVTVPATHLHRRLAGVTQDGLAILTVTPIQERDVPGTLHEVSHQLGGRVDEVLVVHVVVGYECLRVLPVDRKRPLLRHRVVAV